VAQPQLQPTRLSRLDFEMSFATVGGSDQNCTLQTRLAAESRRWAAMVSSLNSSVFGEWDG